MSSTVVVEVIGNSQAPASRTNADINAAASASFSWHDVGFAVPLPAKPRGAGKVDAASVQTHKRLLQGMNGSVKAGQVVAIMGGSGAGKSTLLNTLAGRVGPGELTGSILVNGKPRNPATWQTDCAYVEQDDLMYQTLTVEETLSYAARLRLPSSMSKAEKAARVSEVIASLGLTGCRNTRIGSQDARGISGGERKRVSIGIELVANPRILFLDEPTSGLDAFNALNVIATIKDLAVKQNKIVLMTIHQPRTDILDLFDKIILLSVGKMVWFGDTQAALEHFAALGHPLPAKTNPSDHFLDVITIDQRSPELRAASMERIDKFSEAWEKSKAALQTSSLIAKGVETGMTDQNSHTDTVWTEGGWKAAWVTEFSVLLNRNFVNVARDIGGLIATFIQSIVIMLLLGFIFFQSGDDYAGTQNKVGVLFFMCINMTFSTVMPMLAVFPLERAIITRERAAGTYRASSVFLAKWISTLPMLIVSVLVFAIPVYWMIGLRNDIGRYFMFILILLVHGNVANALGLLIGSAVKKIMIAQILAPLIVTVFLLFGGPLVSLASTSWVFRWIQYISIIAISNKALAQNQFAGLSLTCTDPRAVCFRDGQQVIDTFSLGSPGIWESIGQNVGLMILMLALAFIAFSRTSQPTLRLK
eukprot:jgi/Hompol1/3992/HPOL_000688-RA